MTNLYVRLYKDVFLNCMTIQMATELSVAIYHHHIYLYFLNSFGRPQQMLRYNYVFLDYLITVVLKLNSCKDVLIV